jgi:hypothetical protein
MTLVIAPDGIIVQLVGELHTENAATRDSHSLGIDTYVRAVSDLAFALVLFPRCALSPQYPKYKDGTAPGFDLHNLLFDLNSEMFARQQRPIIAETPLANPHLILPPEIQTATRDSLQQHPRIWKEFIRREWQIYGSEAKHYQNFALDLNNDDILRCFNDLRLELGAEVEPFTKFVKICVGTHIGIDQTTAKKVWEFPGKVVRVPHVTRVQIQRNLIRYNAVDVVKNWVAPQVLAYAMLRPSMHPSDFFYELVRLRELNFLREFRERLAAAVEEYEAGHGSNELDRLAADVERVGRQTEIRNISGEYVAEGVVTEGGFLTRLFAKHDWEKMLRTLKKIFKTLDDQQPRLMIQGLARTEAPNAVAGPARAAPLESRSEVKPMTNSAKRFSIALSFPGEHRAFVEDIASHLAQHVGRDRVLYDRFYEAEFARLDLDTYLQRLYHDESELIAVFLCAEYERKE